MDTIPQGYKDSKLGIIPEDWDVVKLKDNFSLKARIGWQGLKKSEFLDAGKFHLITGTDFENGKINWNKTVYVEKERYDQDKNIQVKVDDILITKDGSIGKIAHVDKVDKPTTLNSGVFVLRPKIKAYSKFIYFNLESVYFKKFINTLVASSSIAHLYQKDFEGYKFVLPSYKEQKKIAEILTTWDNAIEQQESLIQEKEQLKKGLMEKLLSGEKRFRGFTSEWEEVLLGTIFKERSKRYKDLDLEEIEEYSELLSVGINSGVTKRSENDAKDNSSSDKGNYKILKKNDIAYNTMRMWQGASGVSSYNGIVSPAYTIVTLKHDYNIDFFGYLFKLHRVVFNFYRYSQGLTSDTWNIKYPHFSEVIVKIPTTKDEQDKIVNALKSADSELDLLQEELKELKLQKKGLMQNLLTGKVRVKV